MFCPVFLLEKTLLSDLRITLKLYLTEAVGEHVTVSLLFLRKLSYKLYEVLLRVSHIHCRTTLGFIPFFPICNLQTGFPLLIKTGFDNTWEMQ